MAIVNPSGVFISESKSAEEEEVVFGTLNAKELLEERIYKPVFIERRPDLYGPLVEKS
jgi:predicted amidohydrolase